MTDILHDVSVSPAFTVVPSPYLLLDRSLRIQAANAAYLSVTGREASELLGVPLFEAFPDNPADPTADGVVNVNASLQRVLSRGCVDEMLFQRYDIATSRRPDVFEYRVWSPVNMPVRDEDGRVAGVLHHAEDVTTVVRLPVRRSNDVDIAQAGQMVRASAMAAHRYRHAHSALDNENQLLRQALSISVRARMPNGEAALRRAWWWHRIVRDVGTRGWAHATVTAMVDELPVDAAAITVHAGDAQRAGLEMLAATDNWAMRVEELAFTVGEGPAVEASTTGLPVLVDNVIAVDGRWPGYTAVARSAGLAGVFVFPLMVDASSIGALALYRKTPGNLTGGQLLDAALVADMTTAALLTDPDAGEPIDGLDEASLAVGHFEHVHTAAGVIAARNGITPDEALRRLRARAFATDRSILDVARSILAGEHGID